MKPSVLPYILIASLSLLFVNGASAQSAGAAAALFKAHEEVTTEPDRAAAIINSAAGVSVSISPGNSVRRRMSGELQYAVMHPFSVEIYRIIEGSGTLVTGGLLNLPLANPIYGDVVHPNMAQKAARQGRSKKATFRFATRHPPLV
ncbi:MAG: hypothetical protein VX867_04070 [Pseudomonadota bacterium]|nr:hypothetical protein [Pseudomonadota bacterium]